VAGGPSARRRRAVEPLGPLAQCVVAAFAHVVDDPPDVAHAPGRLSLPRRGAALRERL